MESAILICGALGAWLLVAGPVYQAALELQDMEFDREGIDAATASVPRAPKVSPWWWLVPPVAYFKQRNAATKHRQDVMDALGPEQRVQTVNFLNKGRGWLIVAAGAFLLAIKETWELSDHFEWPVALFWVLIVVLPILCVGNAALTLARSARVLEKDKERAVERRSRGVGR